MGSEHQNWESYLSSAHGQQFLKHGGPDEPGEETYPVCQTCHMNQGEHGVMTAWGGLGLREPGALDDPDWAEAQSTLLRFLGLLDSDGQPTKRMDRFQRLGVIRSSGTRGQRARAGMLRICLGCHEARFVKKEIESAEEIARQADLITAEAIRVGRPHFSAQGAEPEADGSGRDAFTLEDSDNLLGQHIFTMFRKHRKSAWRGAFHMSPERSFWKGLHQLRRDMVRIRDFKDAAAEDENSRQEFSIQESE
jgi:cytochrome c553